MEFSFLICFVCLETLTGCLEITKESSSSALISLRTVVQWSTTTTGLSSHVTSSRLISLQEQRRRHSVDIHTVSSISPTRGRARKAQPGSSARLSTAGQTVTNRHDIVTQLASLTWTKSVLHYNRSVSSSTVPFSRPSSGFLPFLRQMTIHAIRRKRILVCLHLRRKNVTWVSDHFWRLRTCRCVMSMSRNCRSSFQTLAGKATTGRTWSTTSASYGLGRWRSFHNRRTLFHDSSSRRTSTEAHCMLGSRAVPGRRWKIASTSWTLGTWRSAPVRGMISLTVADASRSSHSQQIFRIRRLNGTLCQCQGMTSSRWSDSESNWMVSVDRWHLL